MDVWDSVILGIVQGLTEFLPISSSGHLVIVEHVLGLRFESLTFEVIVHFGTLLSVLAVFGADVFHIVVGFFRGMFSMNPVKAYSYDSDFRYAVLILIGSIPAGLVGILFSDEIKGVFHDLGLVGAMLIATGIVLIATRAIYVSSKKLNFFRAILVGIAQAFAIFPGVSRSGFTISTGLFSGLSREEAVKFSFLLSVPAIFGANLIELSGIKWSEIEISFFIFLVGFFVAFVTGYAAIRVLIKMVRSGRFSWFGYYCLVLGGIVLLFL